MSAVWQIRPLADYAEMKRAADFQRVIWGATFAEIVPPSVFWFVSRIDGIVAGAFDSHDEIVGLVFGMTGTVGGRPLHWSDMLAVHPAWRGRGLGIALKRYQRDVLLSRGVTTAQWTFDPLESRNAHLNFNRFGITAHEYIRDCYGASASPLHRGIGTDRLIATWRLDSPRVRQRMEGGASSAGHAPEAVTAPVINAEGEALRLDLNAPLLRLRIPAEIQALKERDEVSARRWREHTRAGFEAYLGRGYVVAELIRDGDAGSNYLLARDEG